MRPGRISYVQWFACVELGTLACTHEILRLLACPRGERKTGTSIVRALLDSSMALDVFEKPLNCAKPLGPCARSGQLSSKSGLALAGRRQRVLAGPCGSRKLGA